MDRDNTFGAWAKGIREERRYSQDDIAKMTGYSQVTVSRVEQGQVQPTADYIVAFAKAMGIGFTTALAKAGIISAKNSRLDSLREIARLLATMTPEDQERAIAGMEALLRVWGKADATSDPDPVDPPPRPRGRAAADHL